MSKIELSSDTNELDQESKQALLLEEAYNLGYYKVKNGCLQVPLKKLNQLIATKEQEARIDEITGLQQAMFKEQDVYKYSRKRLKELKGDI